MAWLYEHVAVEVCYRVKLEEDGDALLVTSPDFPELTTFGGTREDALAQAADALQEAIAARIYDGRPVPCPTSKMEDG